MDCIRPVGGISLLFPKKSSSSLSFSASTSSNVKPLSLNEARYFLTVFRDVSAWAAIDMILRPLVYILIIFLILLILIVVLAMLLEVMLNLAKMVASTALAARSGWSVWPGITGHFAPELGGQYQRYIHLYVLFATIIRFDRIALS